MSGRGDGDNAGQGQILDLGTAPSGDPPSMSGSSQSILTTSIEVPVSARHRQLRNTNSPSADDRSFIRGRLVVISERDRGGSAYLDAAVVTIGRGAEADIVVHDLGTSRIHAKVIRHSNGFRIMDSGSENGTFLNSRPIDEAELFDGDVIGLGNTRVRFESVGWRRKFAERPSAVSSRLGSSLGYDSRPHFSWFGYASAAAVAFLVVAVGASQTPHQASSADAAAQQYFDRAKEAVARDDWDAARESLEISKGLGLDRASYQTLSSTIEATTTNKVLLKMIDDSILAGQPLTTLQTLVDRRVVDAKNSEELEARFQSEIDVRVERWTRDASRSLLAGDLDGARALVERALRHRPKHTVALKLSGELEQFERRVSP